jgi:hypothetical protein
MRFLFFFLGLVWAVLPAAQAQFYLGVSSSNYAGTQGLYLNPATAADSRHRIFINLVSADVFLTNNYLRWTAPYSVPALMTNTVAPRHRSARGLIYYSDDYLAERLNGRRKHLHVGADVRGPSALVTLNDRHAVALTSRVRSLLNFTDLSEPAARLIRFGTTNALIPAEAFGQQFNVTTNAALELGATYAFVLHHDEDRFVKVGLTVKRLVGLYSAHLIARDIDYRFERDPRIRDRVNVRIESLTAQYGYTDADALPNFSPGWLLGRGAPGAGWGADLGVVYEFRPEHRRYTYRDRNETRHDASKNKYRTRLSASLLDIGGIRYRHPSYVHHYPIQRQNVLFTENNFADIGGINDVFEGIDQTLQVTEQERQSRFYKSLPTALHVGLDQKLRERVYVSGVWMQRLTSARRLAMQVPSVLAVVPRYETRWFEASLPLALADGYSRLTIGAALRLGPIFFGSDDLSGILNLGNPRGLDVYFGATVPLLRRAPRSALDCWPKPERKGFFRKRR